MRARQAIQHTQTHTCIHTLIHAYMHTPTLQTRQQQPHKRLHACSPSHTTVRPRRRRSASTPSVQESPANRAVLFPSASHDVNAPHIREGGSGAVCPPGEDACAHCSYHGFGSVRSFFVLLFSLSHLSLFPCSYIREGGSGAICTLRLVRIAPMMVLF
jgi:hypothetical protein